VDLSIVSEDSIFYNDFSNAECLLLDFNSLYETDHMNIRHSKGTYLWSPLLQKLKDLSSKSLKLVICVPQIEMKEQSMLKIFAMMKLIDAKVSFLSFTSRYLSGHWNQQSNQWITGKATRQQELRILLKSKYLVSSKEIEM
jgi:hypothetical protein